MKLTIATPEEEIVYLESVEWVHVKLSNGFPISIYPGHAPLIAQIISCDIRYLKNNREHQVEISDGILNVSEDQIKCFVEWAKIADLKEKK